MITIKSLCEKIATIAKDKLLHFIFGYFLTDIFINVVFHIPVERWILNIICFFIGVLLSIAKEIYDSCHPNNKFDYKDMIATIIGAAAKILVNLI